MASRIVIVAAGRHAASLSVTIDSSQLCAALVESVKDHLPALLSKLDLTSADNINISLHRDSTNGPALDTESLLSDVLPDVTEMVYAVINVSDQHAKFPTTASQKKAGPGEVHIRVITPELARSHSDLSEIEPISKPVSLDCTLSELKAIVQKHIGLPQSHGVCSKLECNCKLAQVIADRAFLRVDGGHQVIVVHGPNIVNTITAPSKSLGSIHDATRAYLGREMENKIIKTFGGIRSGGDSHSEPTPSSHYDLSPVLAVCSSQRHEGPQPHGPSVHPPQEHMIVDIHTAECPIDITAHNAGLTLADANLEDCAVMGVLNIFAVSRRGSDQTEGPTPGKAAIFKKSQAWGHQPSQSDRGISNFLSTLRVFTHLVANGNMEDTRQDAILHVIHLLTRFPPAVRAAYILMRGETPCLSERAALAQCLHEVLKIIVPLQTVQMDPQRICEGSRLLFGLILEKAKNMKVRELNADHILPYVSMKVYDTRNMITMEPVISVPVQTDAGLLNMGFHNAFKEKSRSAGLEKRSGSRSQVIMFDPDKVHSSLFYADADDVNKIISPAEYTDLYYLATLCSRNQLVVAPPDKLASVTAPALTLDRDGFLAVYVGRAVCAVDPARDILMFRPTTTSEEEGVDVSIITQLLEPILAARNADGTIVFEAYGQPHRKLNRPDEILVLCVDLSISMDARCGFRDVEANEDDNTSLQRNVHARIGQVMTENAQFSLPGPDDLKDFLRTHESFDEFLAIVGTGKDDYQRRRNAEKVLAILQQLDEQQIKAKLEALETNSRMISHHASRLRATAIERELYTLQNRAIRLQKYRTLICAWFLSCLGKPDASPDPLFWSPGEAMPKVYKAASQPEWDALKFEIPRDLCCHISNDLMEDPVLTTDNFTYERKNIERWFQTNETSPLTNLVLGSLELWSDARKKAAIDDFLHASDIKARYDQSTGNRLDLSVTLKSPLNTWTMQLAHNLTLRDLWEIAFRKTKGRYSSFELQHRNARIPPSSDPISTTIRNGYNIFIVPLDQKANSGASTTVEELCLVKVYDGPSSPAVTSYWETKFTTRTLASAMFRYYRQKLAIQPTASIAEVALDFTTGVKWIGDGWHRNSKKHTHWKGISSLFNDKDSTGTLREETCIDQSNVDVNDTEYSSDGFSQSSHDDEVRFRPLVLKLYLRDPRKLRKRDTLSCLDVLKQIFDAFINRTLAYNYQTHIGLVTFSTKASVSQEITHVIENFRHSLNNMTAKGDTALWDGIALAQDQLEHYARDYPTANLRIICISDGEDTSSTHQVVPLASRLVRRGVLLDSFSLGKENNKNLQTLSCLTGGYVFNPRSLEEAMAICELEPVLSTSERPVTRIHDSRVEGFRVSPTLHNFMGAMEAVEEEYVSEDYVPERKENPQLSRGFIELGPLSKNNSLIKRSDTNLRLNRIHSEIRNSGSQLHPHYDVYICEPNFGLWKVVMQGPPESTYANGTFLLYVDMGDDYPLYAPKARFITPVYHPNINRHGRICHSILDRNWTTDTSTKDLIDTIYSLLLVPEFSDPINTVVTLNYHWDEVKFKEEAQEHILRYATQNREAWRCKLIGEA